MNMVFTAVLSLSFWLTEFIGTSTDLTIKSEHPPQE